MAPLIKLLICWCGVWVVQEVVAACELVNSQSVEVQCSKLVPTIAVDNVEGCQVIAT